MNWNENFLQRIHAAEKNKVLNQNYTAYAVVFFKFLFTLSNLTDLIF